MRNVTRSTFRNPDNQALSIEQIKQVAPSAFATEPYNKVSSKYAYLSTISVIENLMSIGFLPVSASQSRTRIADKSNFTRHQIRFRQNNAKLQVGDVFPEAVLINSHDRSSQWEFFGGIFRLACTNGMVVSESMIAKISVRHVGNVLADAREAVETVTERMPLAINAIANWSKIVLAPKEQLALAEAAHTLRYEQNSPFTPEQLLKVRRAEDNKNDLWTTFNRVQENLTQGGQHGQKADANGRVRNATSRAITSIDGDVKLNRALWQLGERMAELKA